MSKFRIIFCLKIYKYLLSALTTNVTQSYPMITDHNTPFVLTLCFIQLLLFHSKHFYVKECKYIARVRIQIVIRGPAQTVAKIKSISF